MYFIIGKSHLIKRFKRFYTINKEKCILNRQTRNISSANEKTFEKILIANRGEIACRIIKTARQMGIKTVAIYSTADIHSKHVSLAEESLWIGPSEAQHSYLDMNKILEAIKKSGAEAVHPGYGFLSENATFVDLLEKENITFIGPSAKSIRQMGDKLESKRAALSAGVNTIPGHDDVIKDADECVLVAGNLGYPIMIKATAGGGGKGMRIAHNDAEAREGFKLSTQEALSSFGDGRILIEKFIPNPRHIEIQVVCDNYGNAIHLCERECSIQRRNQKVIEEAPSVFLDPATRHEMGSQAVALCKSLGYTSVGTVEFLVDGRRNSDFYFLEMNTRLQVEHPVTELVTGVDLVAEMIRIASGQCLSITSQDSVSVNGWAIESRIYAEDPYKQFGMPSTGLVHKYQEPTNIRCDTGIQAGSQVNIFYDSMVSKVIVHRSTREEAIRDSINALDNYVIHGVTHNMSLLREVLASKSFSEGKFTTKYLEESYPDGFKHTALQSYEEVRLIAVVSALYYIRELRSYRPISQNEEMRNVDLVVTMRDRQFELQVSMAKDGFIVVYNDEVFKIGKDINLAQSIIKTVINEDAFLMQLLKKSADGSFDVLFKGVKYHVHIVPARAFNMANLIKTETKKEINKCTTTPMPGLVKKVSCRVGDFVEEGQELCIIEAMKMQNAILSAGSGCVSAVNIKEGDTVCEDDVLIRID